MAESKFWNHKVAENIFVLFLSITSKFLRNRCVIALWRGQTLIDRCLLSNLLTVFSLTGSSVYFVPFSKYALWKHKVAKAATLWVKLQREFFYKKCPPPG
jgi:hypothetical protein